MSKESRRRGSVVALLTLVVFALATFAGADDWTWVKGLSDSSFAVYGTQGVADTANTPGQRSGAVTWRDTVGNLWLFGGYGHAASAPCGNLNDLWKYDVVSGNWTWMKGSNAPDQDGTYGTRGVPDAANVPGARQHAVSWTDSSGNLWLFGGNRFAVLGSSGYFNDLWKYDVVSGSWTWMKGSSETNQYGTYGTLGVADLANTPGARGDAVSWTDSSGNLWLFGGWGLAASTNACLNDLWKYDVASGNWTWMKGSNAVGQVGAYGTRGVPGAANTPGARTGSVSWTDSSGNLWLFGGDGYAALIRGNLNDLWKYDVASGDWTWMKGSNATGQHGTYGTQGVPDAANTPGGRYDSVSWTDSSGGLWLFGGYGSPASSSSGYLNDLWKYDPASCVWTWMKGSNATIQRGTYGTRGLPDPANTPGARQRSASWTDSSGRLWLFGGQGYAASGSSGDLNDLWKFEVASDTWTWMKGSNVMGEYGTYGTLGLAGAANSPGARGRSISWTDRSGNLWLFGGNGYAILDYAGNLNDLWKYDVATGNWTWMKGSNAVDQYGICGTQGVEGAPNTPGGRRNAVSWTDSSGNLWLFGGWGCATSGGSGYLSDLWKYNVATGNWAWMKGSDAPEQFGAYGTLGVADAANLPGARHASVSWIDDSGSLWLFGGEGRAASGTSGMLNDLWRFDTASGDWTWMKGSNTPDQYGTYGTQGGGDTANTPGARYEAVSWTDSSGNLWLFGGWGRAASGYGGYLNDLWKYDVASGNWTWLKGSNTPYQNGTYGTLGAADSANTPGARNGAVSWIDSSGNLWLSGGWGRGASGYDGYLNDLWKYDVVSGNWTWITGSDVMNQYGTYGTQGLANPTSTPGARYASVSWTDNSGSLWLFGGYGREIQGTDTYLKDLWRFDPSAPVAAATDWNLY